MTGGTSGSDTTPETPGEEGAPPRPVRGRHPPWLVFLLGFPVSLLIGWLFGILTDRATYDAAEKLQKSWYTTVNQMSPVALVTGYVEDVLHAAGGKGVEWTPPPEERSKSPQEVECDLLMRKLEEGCQLRRLAKDGTACVQYDRAKVEVFVAKCPTYYNSVFNPRPLTDFTVQQEHIDWRVVAVRYLLAPALGVARTWNRLTHGGGIAYFLAVVTLLGGLIGFVVLHAAFFGRMLPENFFVGLVAVPAGSVACASVVCFFLKWLMLGALGFFGWITGLAGLCCAATGTASYCWWCFHKFAEYSLGKAVEPRA